MNGLAKCYQVLLWLGPPIPSPFKIQVAPDEGTMNRGFRVRPTLDFKVEPNLVPMFFSLISISRTIFAVLRTKTLDDDGEAVEREQEEEVDVLHDMVLH